MEPGPVEPILSSRLAATTSFRDFNPVWAMMLQKGVPLVGAPIQPNLRASSLTALSPSA